MNRWLVQYENVVDPGHLLDTAAANGIHIVGVYQDVFCFIVEATEKILMKWVATLSVKRIVTGPFEKEEIENEANQGLGRLMEQWNRYLSDATVGKHPYEGLAWDHPGFLPPGKPDSNIDN